MRTMIDHPGWRPCGKGWRRLLSNDDGGYQLVTCGGDEPEIRCLVDQGKFPDYHSVLLDERPDQVPSALLDALRELNWVVSQNERQLRLQMHVRTGEDLRQHVRILIDSAGIPAKMGCPRWAVRMQMS